MAGRGKRFKDAGYSVLKPLITIRDVPMIQLVLKNLAIKGKYVFVCRKEHYQEYSLEKFLSKIVPDCKIISIEDTDGAAESVLCAKELINNEEELIIADSDGWVKWNYKNFIRFMQDKNADGGIVTFKSSDPKFSFAQINNDGIVTKIAEKISISNDAISGIYYFKKGKDFVRAAEKMIQNNIRANNEYYVAPTYNELIEQGKKIVSYPVEEMINLGTPEDMQKFIKI